MICTGFDEAALQIETVLDEHGIHSGTEAWPMITGVGCDAEAVKTIASGRMGFSIFMDPRTTAEECENMVDAYLIQEEDSEAEDPEVNDYESYDNGVKIVGAYLCEAQVIDGDNFEILIDNGFYSEAEGPGRKQRLRRFRQQVPRPRKNRKTPPLPHRRLL